MAGVCTKLCKKSLIFFQREGEEERMSGGQCAESLVSVVNALHLRKHVSLSILATLLDSFLARFSHEKCNVIIY